MVTVEFLKIIQYTVRQYYMMYSKSDLQEKTTLKRWLAVVGEIRPIWNSLQLRSYVPYDPKDRQAGP
jgi:hypothetical protein